MEVRLNKTALVRAGGAASLALGISLALGLPAQASVHTDSSTKGTCTGTSSLKVQVKSHKDMLLIKAKIKGDSASDAFDYTILDNGTTVVVGQQMGHKGQLVIRESIPDLQGTDTIDFTATDATTGEVCTAEVVVDGE